MRSAASHGVGLTCDSDACNRPVVSALLNTPAHNVTSGAAAGDGALQTLAPRARQAERCICALPLLLSAMLNVCIFELAFDVILSRFAVHSWGRPLRQSQTTPPTLPPASGTASPHH